MSIIFASNYAGAFKTVLGLIAEGTTSSNMESTYSDSYLSGWFTAQTPNFAAELTEGWVHECLFTGTAAGFRDGDIIQGYNSVRNGIDWSVITVDDVASFKYWNGSSLTTLSGTYNMSAGTRANWDVYFKKHASAGILRLYKDGTLVLEETGLNTSNFAVDCVRIKGYDSTSSTISVSQVIVADESTIGMKVFSPNLSAGNSNTFTSGAATDVDVDTATKLNTYITGNSNGLKATFAMENIPAGSLVAKAIAVNTRAKKGASGPAHMNMVARVGGTDYNHGTDHNLTVGIDPFAVIYNTNPATGLAWDNTTVDASEMGVRVTT